MSGFSVSFASNANVVAPRRQPKTQGEIMREDMHEKAEAAKAKPREDRNVGDYVTIGIDAVNRIVDNPPVVYANGNKLNYIA